MTDQHLPTPDASQAGRTPTKDDFERADEVAWTMALEGRKLTTAAYDTLVAHIAADRVPPSNRAGIMDIAVVREDYPRRTGSTDL